MAKARIMIVEDDSIVASDIQQSLERFGFEIAAVVGTGEEAVRRAAVSKVDLVLMDILLKGKMDGVEAAETIRRKCDLPVIYLTAYSGGITIDRAKVANPYGYIVKPFDDQVLRTTIEMALHKHRADRDVRVRERIFGAVLDAAGVAPVVLDRNGVVRWCSRMVAAVFNVTPGELTGQRFDVFIAPLCREGALWSGPELESFFSDESDQDAASLRPVELVLCDGRRIAVQAQRGPMEGGFDLVLTLRSDSPAEEAAPRRAQARAAQSFPIGFAEVSHDLRSALNTVIGYSDLLQAGVLDERQREQSEIINVSGRDALEIVDDLLMLEQFPAALPEPETVDFDLEHLVQSVIENVERRLGGKTHSLYYELSDSVPPGLSGAAGKIRNLLMILLRYLSSRSPAGDVGIRVEYSAAAGSSSGGRLLRVAVRSSGLELTADQKRILEQCLSGAADASPAIGSVARMRLEIARRFASVLGGGIELICRPGTPGCEMVFSAPVREAEPVACQQIFPIKVQDLKTKKVAIVDDDPHSLKLLQGLCRAFHMEVLFTASGAELAVRLLSARGRRPDVILCDLVMPEIDGYELVERLADDEELRGIKVVAVTSNINPGTVGQSRRRGFDAYLSKPIAKEDFARVLQATLGDARSGQDKAIITRHLSEEISLKGVRVLVAESDNVRKKIIDVLLNKFGCEVVTVSDGDEAVERADEEEFHVCLIDVGMPGGEHAAKTLRTRTKGSLPVVALLNREHSEKHLPAGITDFLKKPIDARKLREKILDSISLS